MSVAVVGLREVQTVGGMVAHVSGSFPVRAQAGESAVRAWSVPPGGLGHRKPVGAPSRPEKEALGKPLPHPVSSSKRSV